MDLALEFLKAILLEAIVILGVGVVIYLVMRRKYKQISASIQKTENRKKAPVLQPWKKKRISYRMTYCILLLLGSVALVSSIVFESPTLAFIGLSLVFWSVLLIVITSGKYVRYGLLNSTSISSFVALSHLINALGYNGTEIYLPPRYFRDLKSGLVFISAQKNVLIPPVEELTKEKAFIQNPKGICLNATGLALANFFEEELGVSFAKVDLAYLKSYLPKLLTESLQIAKGFEIEPQGEKEVHMKIYGSIYVDFCKQLKDLKHECGSLGCPMCSSIACTLARATAKPIIIKKNDLLIDDGLIEVQYGIIEE